MSFLFVSQYFPSASHERQTGGTISNRNLFREIAKLEEVSVLSFDPHSNDVSQFSSEPFKVKHSQIPPWRGFELFSNWSRFVRSEVTSTLHELADAPAAVIATSSTLSAFDAVPDGVGRVAIVRAFENFGFRCPWVPMKQRVKLGKQAIIRRFQDGRLLRAADVVVTNSEFMRSSIVEHFKVPSEKICVLFPTCGLEVSPQNPLPNSVGFVHRGPEKNIKFVVELALQSPDLTYLIYGHNDHIPSVLPSNVKLMGWCADRAKMFASAALWIVPSVWAEPFGRVSIEAQAANRPVLVADVGGLPETVFDSRFRIRGFEAKQWNARMRELLAMKQDLLLTNGKMIKNQFAEEFHFESIECLVKQIQNRFKL